jgi:hypothetical protein
MAAFAGLPRVWLQQQLPFPCNQDLVREQLSLEHLDVVSYLRDTGLVFG